MIGFHADTKEQVHAFHAAAMAAAGSDEGGRAHARTTARTGTPPICAIRPATSFRSSARRRRRSPPLPACGERSESERSEGSG